ncbi:MAG: hypothetical protein JWM11_1872, partial [Planctomycetaceae bacterium]|nr:hypothetical protein [Planctomycetaceae bacterium]
MGISFELLVIADHPDLGQVRSIAAQFGGHVTAVSPADWSARINE